MRAGELSYRLLICLATGLVVLGAGTAAAAEKKPWKLTASAGVQFDDNVNTNELDNSTGSADVGGVFEFSAEYKVLDSGSDPLGLEVSYDFSQTLYADLSDFDLHSHTGSLFADREIAGFDVSAFYGYTRTLLGGFHFLGLNNFQPGVGRSVTDNWYVSLAYNYQNKNFINANERDSNLNAGEITNFIFFNQARSFVKLGYRFEEENTAAAQFDYRGHYLKAGIKSPLPLPFTELQPILKADYQYYIKDYSGVTAEIGEERDDKRHTVKANLGFPFNKNLEADLNFELIKAISDLPSSDFTEKIFTVTLRLIY